MQTPQVYVKAGEVTGRKLEKTAKNAVYPNFGAQYLENGGTSGLALFAEFEPRTKAIQQCIIRLHTHSP